jgi:hypothetical protein
MRSPVRVRTGQALLAFRLAWQHDRAAQLKLRRENADEIYNHNANINFVPVDRLPAGHALNCFREQER